MIYHVDASARKVEKVEKVEKSKSRKGGDDLTRWCVRSKSRKSRKSRKVEKSKSRKSRKGGNDLSRRCERSKSRNGHDDLTCWCAHAKSRKSVWRACADGRSNIAYRTRQKSRLFRRSHFELVSTLWSTLSKKVKKMSKKRWPQNAGPAWPHPFGWTRRGVAWQRPAECGTQWWNYTDMNTHSAGRECNSMSSDRKLGSNTGNTHCRRPSVELNELGYETTI